LSIFQGGEPLLNFEIIKLIYKLVTDKNIDKKRIAFVICTNLLKVNNEILNFISSNNISISTSLDGPKDLHDSCRIKRNGSGTHDHFLKSLKEASFLIPRENISALVTVTRFNINHLEAVIDEYLAQGFRSIFLRNLNQFGAAHNNWVKVGYSIDKWVKAYISALDYIIQLNLSGKHFSEEYAALLLTRILTPFSTGFVDLQSPSGAGISGVIYDYNGDVYVSDEGRMLSAFTGDKKFCIGNVHRSSYKDIFCGSALKEIVSKTTIESIPGCAWCVYQPYCGSDPVKNYSESGNLVGNRSTSEFCAKQKAIFRILFEYILSDNQDVSDVFWSWITGRDITEIRKPYVSNSSVCDHTNY
jgi:His-Xaa-Ser system radical SAM maturase HxsB